MENLTNVVNQLQTAERMIAIYQSTVRKLPVGSDAAIKAKESLIRWQGMADNLYREYGSLLGLPVTKDELIVLLMLLEPIKDATPANADLYNKLCRFHFARP